MPADPRPGIPAFIATGAIARSGDDRDGNDEASRLANMADALAPARVAHQGLFYVLPGQRAFLFSRQTFFEKIRNSRLTHESKSV